MTDPRRARIVALVTQGATEGERAAARAALVRFDAAAPAREAARIAETQRLLGFGYRPSHSETERMQRGGNWSEE